MKQIILAAMLLCSEVCGQSYIFSPGNVAFSGAAVQEAVPKKATVATVAVEEPFQEIVPERPAPVVSVPVQQVSERYLVSEPWCRYCPAAEARFLRSGGKPQNVISIAQARSMGMSVSSVPYEFTRQVSASSQRTSSPQRSRLPVVNTQWGRIDLETYQRNCNCPMCRGIRSLQQQYRSRPYQSSLPPGQQPTPDNVLNDVIDLLQLPPSAVLADLGCGDGRILVAAVERYGCAGIGVEIDPAMAEKARSLIASRGLSGRIQIITGDALSFRPADHGVTAVTAYLYEDLLEKLRPVLEQSPLVVTPFHQVPGLSMVRHGDVYVYRKA